MKRLISSHGYVKLYAPEHPLASANGEVYEHRLVLHEAGVEIPEGFQVHHVNGDKQDNRIENLRVLSPKEHHDAHVPEAVVTNAELRMLVLLGYGYTELAEMGIWQHRVREVRRQLGAKRRHTQRTRNGRMLALWGELTGRGRVYECRRGHLVVGKRTCPACVRELRKPYVYKYRPCTGKVCPRCAGAKDLVAQVCRPCRTVIGRGVAA